MNRTKALGAGFLLALLSADFASASPIVPDFVGGSTAGGTFRYDYRLLLTPNERLDPAAASGVTCPGKVQCNAAGAFVTLYDIPGFVSASTSAAGWSVTTQSVGNTPSSIKGATIDAPALTNVTFHYTGPVIVAGPNSLSFSGFDIVSTVGGVNTHGAFSSQATLSIGQAQGLTDQGVGSAFVPSATIGSIPSQGNAGGSLVPVLEGGPFAAGGNFAYNYAAHLAGFELADPSAASGVTCPGMGANIQCDPPGIFFTIYDIPGFVSASSFAPGWSLTEQFVGSTPSSIAAANDDPSLMNVTFRYTGPVFTANGGDVRITGFQIISSFDAVNIFGTYTGQSIEDGGFGLAEQGVGSVAIPLGPNAAPEPATLALIVSGLAGIGLARRRTPARRLLTRVSI